MKTGSKERDLFLKLCRYCAYRERAISEVRKKMTDLEILTSNQDQFILLLQEERFVNERRFAQSFANGKFRNNSWGKYKIIAELRSKKIKQADIDFAMMKLSQEEYETKLVALIHKKKRTHSTANILVTRKKIADFLQRKGYEVGLVWQLLKQELPD
jgi:regulatory protein